MRDRVRQLSTGVAIYGAGDAAIQIVNFLLLAVYVKGGFLRDVDYGALAVVGAIEALSKVVSRWGLDGAFMRYFHERAEGLPRFASSLLLFIFAADSIVFGTAVVAAGWIGPWIFGDDEYTSALRLMLVNTWIIAFTFVPFHAMRMQNRAVTYSAFAFARSLGTLVLRIVFVILMGLGLSGMYLADLVITLAIVPMMWPWFRPYVRAQFSMPDLRVALRFGLPRVPHGLAQQVLDGGNKLLFRPYISLGQLGVYQNGVTLGTGIKFFTSAFETAWAPFYYETSRQPDAKDVFRKVTTYGIAVLTLLVAGTSAIARDVILVMLRPEYLEAAPILPLVALGMGCQGIYLLTSIGLNLTSRTELYPVATFAAAGTGIGAGILLMPRFGAVGAAVAFLLAYVVQAGVAFALAQRVYPVRYEGGRIARVIAAGLIAALAALWLVPPMPPLAGLLVRGLTTVAVYVALLWLSGFLRPTERAFLREILSRFRQRRSRRVETNDAG